MAVQAKKSNLLYQTRDKSFRKIQTFLLSFSLIRFLPMVSSHVLLLLDHVHFYKVSFPVTWSAVVPQLQRACLITERLWGRFPPGSGFFLSFNPRLCILDQVPQGAAALLFFLLKIECPAVQLGQIKHFGTLKISISFPLQWQ